MSAICRVGMVVITVATVLSLAEIASAQSDRTSYQLVPQTVCVKEPVTRSRWIEETVYEKQKVTSYKPIWQTEKRERTRTYRKPIRKTSMREERTIVRKPVRETKYRERRVEETTYELSTEIREQEYTVRKPVVETQMREEQVTVRRKVTEDMIEVQNVLTYRPVTVPQQQLVPIDVTVNQQFAITDPNSRPRMRWLPPGNHTDPESGQSVFRRRGLHWVQPQVAVEVASTVPVLAIREGETTTMVPETIQRRRPVQLTRYVDSVETRKVPVTVKRMIEETATRQVSVTVKKPITKVTIEKVPYTETRYVEEVVVRKVPVVETEYQEVTEVEPYEVQVARWVTVTEEVEVPKVVRRRVDYETTQEVRKTVMMKVPVDDCGVPIGPAVPLYDTTSSGSEVISSGSGLSWATDFGTTQGNFSPVPADVQETEVLKPSETNQQPATEIRYPGQWNSDAAKPTAETLGRRSILVPETSTPSATNPSTNLKPIIRDNDAATLSDEDSGSTETPNPAEQPDAESTSDEEADAQPAAGEESDVQPAKGAESDDQPATGQGADAIASLPVAGQPDASVPPVARPDVQPSETGDEFAAEKAAAKTGIGSPDLNQSN
jgi:hypothetical protein